MSQFKNETFQFDFVKCLLQIPRESVAMATDLSFHFIDEYSMMSHCQGNAKTGV